MPTTFVASPPPPPASRDEFVNLLPHHALCVDIVRAQAAFGIQEPGKYELEVTYRSPASAAWVKRVFGIDVVDAVIQSTRITVEVKP